MNKQHPQILYLYEDSKRIKLPEKFLEFFNISYALVNEDLTLSSDVIGIILDIPLLKNDLYEQLSLNKTIGKRVGFCIVSDSVNLEIVQNFATFYRTIFFTQKQLQSNSQESATQFINFFISIVNMYHDEIMQVDKNRSDTIETLRVIAHQWRQPLNLISLESINLVVQASLEEVVPKDVIKSSNFIAEQTQRMSDVLKSILSLGKAQRVKELFSLNDLLHSIEEFFLLPLKNEKIVLHIDYLSEDHQIFGFINDLREVLINIVANAKDAYLSQTRLQESHIHLHVSVDWDHYVFIIKDEAGGVPEAIQTKIFEPNFSTKSKGEGFGIGLHIARIIIDQEFGGTLTLQSNQVGSEFIIKIPRTDLSNLKFIR